MLTSAAPTAMRDSIQPLTQIYQTMSISDELTKLSKLRDSGVLSPEEFEQAKKKVLAGGQDTSPPPRLNRTNSYQFEDRREDSIGKAANRYVSFQIIMAVITGFLILFIFLPRMCSSSGPSLPSGLPGGF